MTANIPYSFVPGTKAKAEEVNANFIALVDKIEETNDKIIETQTQTNESITSSNQELKELIEQKANKALDNLDSTGKAVLSAKADKTELDGNWVSKYYSVYDSRTFNEEETTAFNISSYLPKDGKPYEVLISTYVRTGTTYGNTAAAKISTDITPHIRVCRVMTRANADSITSGCAIVVVGSARKIEVYNADSHGKSGTCGLTCLAYRKVR